MTTYKQAQAQIARLQREADAARQVEAAAAIEEFKALIALYGLSAADLGLGGSSRSRASRRSGQQARSRKVSARKSARPGAGIAKYRDPKSGATWSGLGRIPGWLASVKDWETFRIADAEAQPQTDSAPAEPDAAAKSKPAKATRKVGAKAAGKRPAAKKRGSARRAPAQQAASPEGNDQETSPAPGRSAAASAAA